MADWINCYILNEKKSVCLSVTISMVHTVVASVKCSRHKMSFGCIPSFRNCLMRNFFITTLVRPRLAQIDDSTFSFLRAVSLARYSYCTLVKGVLVLFSNWLSSQLFWSLLPLKIVSYYKKKILTQVVSELCHAKNNTIISSNNWIYTFFPRSYHMY